MQVFIMISIWEWLIAYGELFNTCKLQFMSSLPKVILLKVSQVEEKIMVNTILIISAR